MQIIDSQLKATPAGVAEVSLEASSSIKLRIQSIIEEMSELDDPTERLSYLIDMGKGLKPMNEALKCEQTLIKGCQSRLWLYGEFRDGRITFAADSDAAIVKGIAALLLFVYSNSTPKEILDNGPEFLLQTGISTHLSMNRRNGLANLSREIQVYATRFLEA